MASKTKKKSAKSEGLPQLIWTQPETQEKKNPETELQVEPIEQPQVEGPGRKGKATRKGTKTGKKVKFANLNSELDVAVTQAVPVPKKGGRGRHSKR